MDNEQETRQQPEDTTQSLYNITGEISQQWSKASVDQVIEALHYYSGNVTKAATRLGVHRCTLSKYISNNSDLEKLTDHLRTNKQQGLYEQATDKLQELLECEDPSIVAKVAMKLYDKGTPDTKPQEQEDNKEEQTVKAVAEYLQSLRSTSGPNYPNSDCKDH